MQVHPMKMQLTILFNLRWMHYLIENNSTKEILCQLIEKSEHLSIIKKPSSYKMKMAPNKIRKVRFQNLSGPLLLLQDFLMGNQKKILLALNLKLVHLLIIKVEQLFQNCQNNHFSH